MVDRCQTPVLDEWPHDEFLGTIGIIGVGNLGSAIATGLVESGLVSADRIVLCRRSQKALRGFRDRGFRIGATPLDVARQAGVLVLCVLPQHVQAVASSLGDSITSQHTVISVVTGLSLADLLEFVRGNTEHVVRAMPNTAVEVRQSMTCLVGSTEHALMVGRALFEQVGLVTEVEESQLGPATALCACGVAFFCRAIRAASQGGVQIGFHAEDAIRMSAQVARGAAELLIRNNSHPENEVDKVTTPMGCTIQGLNEMEHHGLSSAFIRGIVTAEEAARQLYKKQASLSVAPSPANSDRED